MKITLTELKKIVKEEIRRSNNKLDEAGLLKKIGDKLKSMFVKKKPSSVKEPVNIPPPAPPAQAAAGGSAKKTSQEPSVKEVKKEELDLYYGKSNSRNVVVLRGGEAKIYFKTYFEKTPEQTNGLHRKAIIQLKLKDNKKFDVTVFAGQWGAEGETNNVIWQKDKWEPNIDEFQKTEFKDLEHDKYARTREDGSGGFDWHPLTDSENTFKTDIDNLTSALEKWTDFKEDIINFQGAKFKINKTIKERKSINKITLSELRQLVRNELRRTKI